MPARAWANEEEQRWLEERRPDFLAARQTNTINEWYAKTYHQWFEAFPVPAPSEAEIQAAGGAEQALEAAMRSKRSQVFWWYQNHTRGTGTGTKPKRAKVIKLDKQRRQMQPVHAYMKLYKTKLEPIIGARWKEHLKTLASGDEGEAWIAFYPRVARELLANETPDIQAAVEKYRKTPGLSPADGEIPEEPDTQNGQQKKVLNQQTCIEGLARTLQIALNNIQEQTGWIGTVLLGGPDPRSGVFSSLVYHSGTTVATGARWDQAEEKWAEIEKSFGDFVPKCYPPGRLEDLTATYRSCFSRASTPVVSSNGPGGTEQLNDRETAVPEGEGSLAVPVPSPSQPASAPAPTPPPTSSSSGAAGASQPSAAAPPAAATTTPAAVDTPSTPSSTPAVDSQPEPPAPVSNAFEDERERTLQKNKALLDSLGLTDARLGMLPSAPGQKKRGPRPKPKSTTSEVARSLRPRTKENAPASTAASQPEAPAPVPSDDEQESVHSGEVSEAELPEWMNTALEHLRQISDDPRWLNLLECWILHETELGFPTGKGSATRLSKAERPEEIDWWLRVGRRDYDRQPEIGDLGQYSSQWKLWWTRLQPSWRELTWPPKEDGEAKNRDWSALHRGGCNAVFLVVISLGWWYKKALEVSESADALLAIDDVVFALKCMQPDTGRKRRHVEAASTSNKRPALDA